MTVKENDEFSSAVLMVAVAVYVALTAMLFAGMVAAKPNIASAISTWAKDYGAIIAGVPVLVAVWVAKQQLDANRRQHVASVKRSFQKELACIAGAKDYARTILYFEENFASILGEISGIPPKIPNLLPGKLVADWPDNVLPSLKSGLLTLHNFATSARAEQDKDYQSEASSNAVTVAKFFAGMIEAGAEGEYQSLAQYWS